MKTTTSIALILTTALALTGCDLFGKISDPDKPSEHQLHRERLDALEAGMAKKADIPPPAPLVTYVPPPQPTCIVEFRIRQCENGGAVDWYPS